MTKPDHTFDDARPNATPGYFWRLWPAMKGETEQSCAWCAAPTRWTVRDGVPCCSYLHVFEESDRMSIRIRTHPAPMPPATVEVTCDVCGVLIGTLALVEASFLATVQAMRREHAERAHGWREEEKCD